MDLINSVQAQQYTTRLTEGQVKKWENTGLLDGLVDYKKATVARLLENQAIEFKQKMQNLNEASEVSDIKGFQNIAFPMVRRVFAGLLANDIVGVQPMSLPNGLIYYLDFKYGTVKAGNKDVDFEKGASVYGDYTGPDSMGGLSMDGTGGFYNYDTSYSQREIVSGTVNFSSSTSVSAADIGYDPEYESQILSMAKVTAVGLWTAATAGTAAPFSVYSADLTALKHWTLVSGSSTDTAAGVPGTPIRLDAGMLPIRRFTKVASNGADVEFYYLLTDTPTFDAVKLNYVAKTNLAANSTGVTLGNTWESDFVDPSAVVIPEIDIRTQTIAITAETRKLRVKWSPELAQDMSAYLNQDPEVELTNILSQTIATEIDREIIGDLLNQASAANYYWSRLPGKFVSRTTGTIIGSTGYVAQTQADWYSTLLETINDVSNTIHRKVIRGQGNFVVCGPDVATMLETLMGWRVEQTPNAATYGIGTQKLGELANRYTVYKDPYMPRNKILVGYKGDSAMETGYVYAPYVPLVVTPTIYDPETFTPNRGAMTRYAKQMIRSDFYGTVTVMDMNIF